MKKRICTALLLATLLAMTACGESQAGLASDGASETRAVEAVQTEAGPAQGDTTTQGDTTQGDTTTQEDTKQEAEMMKIQVGDTVFTAALAENSSVDALKELMVENALTLNMSDYAGMEKGADLGISLPQNNEPMNTQAGDIILYQGRTLVIYYDTNSWSLTPIGKIDDAEAKELKAALGSGDVTVTFSLE